MYLVLFFDQHNYEFNPSLHSSLPKAKAAYEALLLHFDVKLGEGGWLGDDCGEAPHIYRIECDGNPAEKIDVSDDLATA